MELIGLFSVFAVMAALTIWGLRALLKNVSDASVGTGLMIGSPILIFGWIVTVALIADMIGCGIFGQAWIDGSSCREVSQ